MQSDEIEIDSPPEFEIGHKVRSRKLIRNDGTFPGKDIGETLAKKGDVGYVVSIGTFLQSSYIYAVHFMTTGYVVGCRKKELESAENPVVTATVGATVGANGSSPSNGDSPDGR